MEKEKNLLEDMKKAGVKICPHCNNATIRIRGSNFIFCSSNFCKGLKFFCFLCGCKLDPARHCLHFYNKPYGTECKGPGDASEP